jgi:hypothetical protein
MLIETSIAFRCVRSESTATFSMRSSAIEAGAARAAELRLLDERFMVIE